MTETTQATFVKISDHNPPITWGVKIPIGSDRAGDTIEVLRADKTTTKVILGDVVRMEGDFWICAIKRDEEAERQRAERRRHARDVERFRNHRR